LVLSFHEQRLLHYLRINEKLSWDAQVPAEQSF
jgi:hypothetical protein